MSENYSKIHLGDAPRAELHDALGLTGAEVSVNVLPPGGGAPFVHAHKLNEEVYGVIAGRGELYIDGRVVPLEAGDWFRIDPAGRRAVRAAVDSAMTLICIQTKAGSLEGFTFGDGYLCDEKAPWH
ncbi:MAG: cupin domain-containing protein [Sutterella sp.]|nr:cupin domain-containing protein [Sutterella sp.]